MTRMATAALAALLATLAACASAPTAAPPPATPASPAPAPSTPPPSTPPSTPPPPAAPTAPAPAAPALPTPGRYMQIRHPLYGTVLVQVGFPTPQACASAARLLSSGNDKAAPTPCADTSAGAQLLAVATVRDKSGPTLYQVEASTTPLCETFVTDMLAAARGGLTVVADCKDK